MEARYLGTGTYRNSGPTYVHERGDYGHGGLSLEPTNMQEVMFLTEQSRYARPDISPYQQYYNPKSIN